MVTLDFRNATRFARPIDTGSQYGVARLKENTNLGLPFLRNMVDMLGACIVRQ